MTANSKLSVTLSILAVVLLASGVTAILLIGKSQPLLSDLTQVNRKLGHVAQAIQAMHEHPERVAENNAWIADLGRLWTESAADRRLLAEAHALLEQDHHAARAVVKVEQLERQYLAVADDATRRLVTLRDLAVIATIAAIAAGVVLLVLLMFLTRTWLVHPLEELRTACLTAGTPGGDVKGPLSPEVATAGQALPPLLPPVLAPSAKAISCYAAVSTWL